MALCIQEALWSELQTVIQSQFCKYRSASQLPVTLECRWPVTPAFLGCSRSDTLPLVMSFPPSRIDAETVLPTLGSHTLPLSKPQMCLLLSSRHLEE